MTFEPFIPFGSDEDQIKDLHVLRDGVPEDLLPQLVAWTRSKICGSTMRGQPDDLTMMAIIRDTQTAVGVDLGADGGKYGRFDRFEAYFVRLWPLQQLQVVDYLVSRDRGLAPSDSIKALRRVLDLARSYVTVGQVGSNQWRLQERVPEGVRLAVEQTIGSSGDAGQQLAKAWFYLHGLSPSASDAMTWAVRSVESATIPLIVPNQNKPTLGHVLGQMRKELGRTLPLRQEADGTPDHHTMLVTMIESLWVGHQDRHGATVQVSIEQARTSVYLAATLVAWFSTECVVRPRPDA